jgi:kynurenine 3-monooxygenase
MCQPPVPRETRRVIVSGAGPAGLLTASKLLARNKDPESTITYNVTLLDGREDYGTMTKEELIKNHRSWMLGLADHGMDAIRTLPELYNNYVKGEGILLTEFSIYLGQKKITQTTAPVAGKVATEAYIVDRNFIVAALARYVHDTHQHDEQFTSLYSTKCQYVDYENKQVLIRDTKTNEESYIPYDLLIGCDGVRSTVREALIKRHSNFSCDTTDIFNDFKQVHVDLPKDLSATGMSLLPDIFPSAQGIALPETSGKVNISIGYPRHLEKPEELSSSDYSVVAEYLKNNFKAFELVDYDDFAKQWVGQRWNQTGMVHCNFYHSVQCGIVIMGDAAHATSPSIGMGMNTALRDAQVFNEILKEHGDDLDKALPAFSKARVKEGNALSDLAFYLYCLEQKHQMIETLHMIIRSKLSSMFPSLIDEHPQVMIGRRGVALSEVYEKAVKQGIIKKHRSINDRVRMEYFENETGMIKESSNTTSLFNKMMFVAVAVGIAAFFYQRSLTI